MWRYIQLKTVVKQTIESNVKRKTKVHNHTWYYGTALQAYGEKWA